MSKPRKTRWSWGAVAEGVHFCLDSLPPSRTAPPPPPPAPSGFLGAGMLRYLGGVLVIFEKFHVSGITFLSHLMWHLHRRSGKMSISDLSCP